MSDPVEIVALLFPAEGKADRLEEILRDTAAWVKENEPNTLKYHIQREVRGDKPTFLVLESYTDKAAIAAHGGSEKVKALGQAFKEERLLAEPLKLMFTKEVGGFGSRL